MKLKEIISSNNWLSVKLTFAELYPEEEKNVDGYEKVFAHLQITDA